MKTECWLLSHIKNKLETRASLHAGKVRGFTVCHGSMSSSTKGGGVMYHLCCSPAISQ